MEKILMVDGKEVKMRASALIPRLYRFKFGRDIIKDMNILKKAFEKTQRLTKDATEEEKQDAQLSALDLTIFENVSFIMAKHADHTIPDTPEEWLDTFEMFSIYEILPEILSMWNLSQKTTSVPKKNRGRRSGKARGRYSCSGARN